MFALRFMSMGIGDRELGIEGCALRTSYRHNGLDRLIGLFFRLCFGLLGFSLGLFFLAIFTLLYLAILGLLLFLFFLFCVCNVVVVGVPIVVEFLVEGDELVEKRFALTVGNGLGGI